MPSDNLMKDAIQLLDEFLMNSSLGVFLSDHKGKLLDANPAMTKLLGGQNKEEVLTHYIDVTNLFSDKSIIPRLWKTKNLSFKNRMITLSGENIGVSVMTEFAGSDAHPQLIGLICSTENAEADKEVLEGIGTHMRNIFSNVKDFFYVKDINGNIITSNDSIFSSFSFRL